MFLFILLLHSLHSQLLSSGAPVTPNPDTGVSLAEDVPQFNTNYRSTIQIVWTCASVIFASTWVCMHPNVPGYKRGWKERWGLRGRHFVNALLWPDQAVTRAFKQWMGARALHAGMVAKRNRFALEHEGLSGWAKRKSKQLGEDMKAFMEEIAKLGEGEKEEGEVKRLRSRSSRLDAEWGRFSLLLAEQAESSPSETGAGEPTDGNSGTGGAGDVEPMPAGEGRKPHLNVQVKEVGNSNQHLPGDKDWTIVHAHFIQMGGVVFEGVNGAVWYKALGNWSEENVKAFFALRLTKEDIQDRSKADALSKAFVIVQCLWFVSQCIGRRASNLPLTELEVTCLAYIACNVGMYAFWWDKPLNVACPVVIPTRETPPKPEDPPTNVSAGDWFAAIVFGLLYGDIGYMIFPSRDDDNTIPDSLTERYPVNYYYGTLSNLTQALANLAPLAVFGALHTIAWYAEFPSAIEQLLWRGASVTPAILALVSFGVFTLDDYWKGKWGYGAFGPFSAGVVSIGLIASFAARLAFLVLPALQLRRLPPLAYQTVSWSDFLPHV